VVKFYFVVELGQVVPNVSECVRPSWLVVRMLARKLVRKSAGELVKQLESLLPS
jgi:hypothetical protein